MRWDLGFDGDGLLEAFLDVGLQDEVDCGCRARDAAGSPALHRGSEELGAGSGERYRLRPDRWFGLAGGVGGVGAPSRVMHMFRFCSQDRLVRPSSTFGDGRAAGAGGWQRDDRILIFRD